MEKLCRYVLEVKSNMEFEDKSRTLTFDTVKLEILHNAHAQRLHIVHVHGAYSCGIFAYICYSSLLDLTLLILAIMVLAIINLAIMVLAIFNLALMEGILFYI